MKQSNSKMPSPPQRYKAVATVNPFILECLKWTLPSFNLDMSNDGNRDFRIKSEKGMANNVAPDEKARSEPSHLDLHCLDRYMFCSARLKRLNQYNIYLQILH